MRQHSIPSWDEVTLSQDQAPLPVPVVTMVAPLRERQSLYLTTPDCLYAVHAEDGTTRWSQQVTLTKPTRERIYHPGASYPPPLRMTFATPRVVNGVVYVTMSAYGAYTCAFSADDGSLRWRTPTDGRVSSMLFVDFAVPLVSDGIVYSGTYVLNEQDGAVLWRIGIDTREEGTLSLHALSDDTLYATTQMGIYAINAQDGQIRWLYPPDDQSVLSGPPVVSGRLLYAGTGGSVGYPERSYCCALDVETGLETWRYPMSHYIGAVVHNESVYVSSGDRSLYALDKNSGALRWRHQFGAPGHYSATIAQNVLYINADGSYAINSEDGAVLWRQPLGSGPSVTFRQPAVLAGVVYLARIDGRGRGTLYALDTRTGAEYWHTPYPSALAVALAQ